MKILGQTEPVQCRKNTNNRCYLQTLQAAIRYLAIKPTQQVSQMNI